MKIQFNKFLFIIILTCFCILNKTYGQLNEIQIKVALIYQCSQNIQWQNEANFNTFKIAIYGADKSIEKELENLSETATIKNKKIQIVKLSKIDDIKIIKPQVIYISYDKLIELKNVFKEVNDLKSILIFTDNSYNKEYMMINLINEKGTINFEFNSKNIQQQGLIILPRLLLMGGEAGEIKNLYLDTEKELVDEKIKTQKYLDSIKLQEKKIDEQISKINEQSKEINNQTNKIDEQNTQIKSQGNDIKDQQLFLNQQSKDIEKKQSNLLKLLSETAKQKELINEQNDILLTKQKNIEKNESEVKQKQIVLDELNVKIEKHREELEKKNTLIKTQKRSLWWAVVFIIIVLVTIIFIFVAYRTKRKTNQKLEFKNRIINNKNDKLEILMKELRSRANKLDNKNIELFKKNDDITKSINYARRIQTAMISSPDLFIKYFEDYFIFLKPRQVVSGDFYWIKKNKNTLIFAAADCTGHGVPGAFVSMLGMSLLNEITANQTFTTANNLLQTLRIEVKGSLKQTAKYSKSKDGMDIALCIIDLKTNELQFSGANNPLYLFRDNELIQFKADRQPIGIYLRERDFTNYKYQLRKNDRLYLFSDGYVDQFNENNMKFMIKRFKILLLEIHQKSMQEQKKRLKDELKQWQGNNSQTDDIIVIGTKIK